MDTATPVPEKKWDRSGLKEYQDSLSLSRREEDARKLSRLFNEAAKSPLISEVLDWAKAHDIEFIVDRNLRGAAGVYHLGTGVLAISIDMLMPENREDALSTLVHEIRHAWQDWQGLLPRDEAGFTETYIHQALLEADASAFGKLAMEQLGLQKDIARLQARKAAGNPVDELLAEAQKKQQNMMENTPEMLWKNFTEWFADQNPILYGISLTIAAAKAFGATAVESDIKEMVGDMLDERTEFVGFRHRRADSAPRETNLAVTSRAGIALLGRDFSGAGNYFEKAPEGYIEKNVLDTKLAEDFYQKTDEYSWIPMKYWVRQVLEAEQAQKDNARRQERDTQNRAERSETREANRAEREKNRQSRRRSSPSF